MFVDERDRIVRDLLANGHSRSQVARRLGLNRDTVSRIAARVGFPSRARRHSGIDWAAVREYYATGHSIEACKRKFGFSSSTWEASVCRGDVVPRVAPTQGQGHGVTRRKVAELVDKGISPAEIASRLGVSKSTVAYHARKLGIPAREPAARRFDWELISRAYESGLTVRECMARFGFSSSAWSTAVKRGAIRPRAQETPLEDLLVVGSRFNRGHLKQRLIKAGLKENRCEICGITEWNGRPLNTELHHVNGDGKDNRIENLQLLCGNCHSQTDNWGGRGVKRNGDRPG
jgi:DNA-binding CsgD family transcriptional regulator/5-methylcytosine-specific restriction endonuclease McrA